MPNESNITKVGEKKNEHAYRKTHKHKNAQQGLVSIHCYKIFAHIKVKDKR